MKQEVAMSPLALLRHMCCRRRCGARSVWTFLQRQTRAARAFDAQRRAISSLAKEKAKVAPSFVQHLGKDPFLVDAKPSNRHRGRAEAKATSPVTLPVHIPKDYEPGQALFADGPHGRIQVPAPPEPQPGSTLQFRLAPPPEFRIGIPEGASAGTELMFKRPDGVEVSVPLPKSAQPGGTIDVPPPCVMVQVPEGIKPGESVIFHADPDDDDEWCMAKVPEGCPPGSYFAARLPPPGGVPTKKDIKREAAAAQKLSQDASTRRRSGGRARAD